MQRLTAFEAEMPLYRSQHVQVLGVSVDDPAETVKWAENIRVTFPLLADKEGVLSKGFGLLDASTNRSSKALSLVYDGQVVHTEKVTSTEIPVHFRPWISRFIDEN